MSNSDLYLHLMKTQKRASEVEVEGTPVKVSKPRELSVLKVLSVSPKQSHAANPSDQNTSKMKTPRRNGTLASDIENIQKHLAKTPKTPRTKKKVLHTSSYRSMKRPKKETSPITKKLQTVTENLIKANQFKSDTPTKSFKIFCSKNDNDEEEEESYDADDEFPWTRKQIYRPREELPTQYLGSNVSFEDGTVFIRLECAPKVCVFYSNTTNFTLYPNRMRTLLYENPIK